ncbi:MAG: N-acetylmuramoyl-L-alanine amidase XlyA [Syntrophomonadaceae bacterium]|nr:N-acetylmuramoyl-L-alanine amidase XlyA [Bacillota bacterium]
MFYKNEVPYIINHIPLSSRRPGLSRQPKTLTVHSTGNPRSTAQNERAWLVNPRNIRVASWHVAVDEKEAVEAIPLNEVAWHAGDGRQGEGNAYSIAVEICESGDRAKTLDNAARVIAALLREQGLTMADVVQHFNWNKKNCPRILRAGKLWNEFLAAAGSYYEGEAQGALEAAVALLVKEEVVRSPDYWLENAKPGKLVRGEFAAVLIISTANRLRGGE